MMRLAVIPARGGSKRIPRKALAKVAGRPLLAHAMALADETGLFDEVCVTTDDEDIAAIAADHGHPPLFRRPAELSGDHVPLLPVLQHACAAVETARGRPIAWMALIYPCSPLLNAQCVHEAFALFREAGGTRTVLAVTEGKPIERARYRNRDGTLQPAATEGFRARTQDQRKAYYDAGALAIFSRERVFEDISVSDRDQIGYILPPLRGLDIDEPSDLETAELLYRLFETEKAARGPIS